jgi:hypothetical protein
MRGGLKSSRGDRILQLPFLEIAKRQHSSRFRTRHWEEFAPLDFMDKNKTLQREGNRSARISRSARIGFKRLTR